MTLIVENGRFRTTLTPQEQEIQFESMVNSLGEDERKALYALLADEQADQNPVLKAITELEYAHKPVSPAQFYTDQYYMGHLTLWPKLLDDLVELHDGEYEEAILTGSFGWGKSYFAGAALCYVAYQLSCLRNPQRSFGLDPISQIYLTFVGPTINLAQRGVYEKVTGMLKSSPYFQDNFPPRVIRIQTWFPRGIGFIAGSTASNAGMALDVFGGCIDEANFFRAQKSVTDLRTMLDRAKLIYEAVRRRMENRFMRSGRLPGLLVIDSSAAHHSSFTMQKIKEAKYNSKIFVRDYASWHVQPKERFLGKYFWVAVGDGRTRARILDEQTEADEYKKLGANVHEVPIEFRRAFDQNLEAAIQDVLGLPTSDTSYYIQNYKAIEEATKENRHPFTTTEFMIGMAKDIFRWSLLSKQVEVEVQGGYKEQRWVPLINPNAPRCIHLDLSKNADATGVCMGHIDRYVEVIRRDPESGDDVSEQAPVIYIDLMLRVVPPPGKDIILGDVRALIYMLQEHGFHIYRGTCDQYQSLDTIQQFEAKGIEAEVLSVDKTPEAYETCKTALYEGRILAYKYQPWIDELKSLKRVVTHSNIVKIDHPNDPKEGVMSKDVADAVAAVVNNLTHKSPGRFVTGVPAREQRVQDLSNLMSHVDIQRRIEQDKSRTPMPFLVGDDGSEEEEY